MPTSEKLAPDLTDCSFRLHCADGAVHEFSTLASVLGHLDLHYEVPDLTRAAEA